MDAANNALLQRAIAWAPARWRNDHVLWVEVFALINLAFLSLDIYLAHSSNDFFEPAEYIPLYFSLVAPVLLAGAIAAREFANRPRTWRVLGYAVGVIAILVGLSGVIYHLDSQFFYERTLRSLTYAAPFAAPLSYAGNGLLLVMNRMVDPGSKEWAQWIMLLTLGGFVGNFALSLTDHAQNSFYTPAEWIPVIAAAFAVAFLGLPLFVEVDRDYLRVCAIVLALEVAVGVTGFVLHGIADINGPSRKLFDNMIYGAPPFAPLLFPNLSLLGWIGLWVIRPHVSDRVRAEVREPSQS
jgi:hypothetical protein